MSRRLGRSGLALMVFLHDTTMVALSFLVALYLRVGEQVFVYSPNFIVINAALLALVAAVVFRVSGLYRGVWRYASLNDLVAITKAVTLVILVFVPLTFLFTRAESLPRSLPVINWLLLLGMLGGPRLAYRLLKDGRLDLRSRNFRRVPALLVGTDGQAELFVRAMEHNPDAAYRVVGLLDEDGARVGYQIHGVEVLGSVAGGLRRVIHRLEVQGDRPERIILASDGLAGPQVGSLLEEAQSLGLRLCRLPKLTEFKRDLVLDRVTVRPIDLEDLLNRPQARLDRDGIRELVEDRRVLVTGAGGSIGSELVRQLSDLGPARLVLLDSSEYNLYAIDMELAERHPRLRRVSVLASVRDKDRIEAVMAREKPDLVFHAAALKHVPMVESNASEGVLTNVHGTRVVADACRVFGVEVMVMISTDKAVNPANIMGASKRLAESYCQSLDVLEGCATRYVTVRFGNVLGSSGSVVPLFQKQLARGGPLTVTHPDITRYFMTIREAVELVLQASALRDEDAEQRGRLFVLDMGEPVRIQDLARQMIRLAGLRPDRDVKIDFTGLRPGEKLTEELFHDEESLVPTAVKGIRLAAPRVVDHAVLLRALDGLISKARSGEEAGVRSRLHALVPESRFQAVAVRRSASMETG